MKHNPVLYLFFGFLLSSTQLFAQKTKDALNTEFDQLIQAQYKPDGPGATVLIAQKGQIIYHKAFGMANLELGVPMRTDHVFRIGSITKQFTGAAIMQLMEQGKLSLQDELTKFLPDYPTHGKKITIEHLLTHTSGIKSYTDMEAWDGQVQRKDFTPEALVDYFKDQPMDFDPDAEWRYNNSGYILLGVIIEKVSGQSYGDYITEHFFKPLGMKNSYYGDTRPVIKNRASGYSQGEEMGTYANAAFLSMTQPYAAGSLLSTVEDLSIWSRALHNGKVVKPESFKKATTPYVLPNGTNTHYGYGLQMSNLLGSPVVEHGGGIHGFLSDLIYLPQEEVCVAILTNCDCVPPGDLAPKLAALTIGKAFQPKAISIPAKDLEQYVGVYENDKKEQRIIRLEDGQLTSFRKGLSKFKLQPYAQDAFFFEESFARITFIREKTGNKKVIKANVSDRNAEENIWVKTDQPLPDERQEIQLTAQQLMPFAGEYNLMPGFNIAVSQEGTHLFCQATGQQRFEIFPSSATRFFLKVVEADIEFYPEADGTVNKMILFQGGQQLAGTRIKK
jgi:CubicO group peptidase (beta-lactamase class C family)